MGKSRLRLLRVRPAFQDRRQSLFFARWRVLRVLARGHVPVLSESLSLALLEGFKGGVVFRLWPCPPSPFPIAPLNLYHFGLNIQQKQKPVSVANSISSVPVLSVGAAGWLSLPALPFCFFPDYVFLRAWGFRQGCIMRAGRGCVFFCLCECVARAYRVARAFLD